MTLAAELVGFLEVDQFSASRVEHIPVVRIMTGHAPPVFLIVFEYDIVMEFFQFSALEVDFHFGMTLGAGEYPLGEGRRWDLYVILFVS